MICNLDASQDVAWATRKKKNNFSLLLNFLMAFTAPSFYFDSLPSFITVIAIQQLQSAVVTMC